MPIHIRKAQKSDSKELFTLMRELAIFEKYIDIFAITPEAVIQKGFEKNPPDFYCLVAEDAQSQTIVGIAVYYFLPYTSQNRPALYLKELYVSPDFRGRNVGQELMQALKSEAKQNGCSQIKWLVAPWNEDGKRFYERLGARENREWLNYEWEI